MGFSLPILAYHKVDSRRELGITALSPERFEKQIKFLKQRGYISLLPDIKKLILNRDFPSHPFIITFDDGYEGMYIHAYPLLREFSFTAIVFVTTGYIGKYNNWDASPGARFKHLSWTQIREMANYGILFGSHGVNHTFLTRQNDRNAIYEIEASKKKLEDGLGKPVQFFSYPYGNYNERIINLVRKAGYDAAFSLRPEFLREESLKPGLIYKFPRIAIYALDNMRAFKAKIGLYHNGSLSYIQKIKNQLINRCAYASVPLEKLRLQIIADQETPHTQDHVI